MNEIILNTIFSFIFFDLKIIFITLDLENSPDVQEKADTSNSDHVIPSGSQHMTLNEIDASSSASNKCGE